jgi:hypothetical protein
LDRDSDQGWIGTPIRAGSGLRSGLDRDSDQAWIAQAIGLQSKPADISPPALFLKAITYTDKALEGARVWNDAAGRYVPVNGNIKLLSTEGGEAIYKNYIGLSAMWMF